MCQVGNSGGASPRMPSRSSADLDVSMAAADDIVSAAVMYLGCTGAA